MKLPRFVPIRIIRDCPTVDDVAHGVAAELDRLAVDHLVGPGERIAVTAGSRGINRIDVIIRAVVDRLKSCGAEPFIVPAMGSHAGATAEGQKDFIAGYGITARAMGCPVVSSMDTVELGTTGNGVVVHADAAAAAADGIVVVNRVKPHTGFSGAFGSGLLKMLSIGLGKHAGAISVHQRGVDIGYGEAIREAGLYAAERLPIRFGLAIVENIRGTTARVEAVLPEDFAEADVRLHTEARRLMGRLPVDFLHLLIVDRIGKDVSGTGMDPNVIGFGRGHRKPGIDDPTILRIFVRDLTEATHGNAIGLGFADFTTDRLVEKMDNAATWENCVTSIAPGEAHVPIHYPADRRAVEMALRTCGTTPIEEMRIIRIRDTEHVDTMLVSESVWAELSGRDDVEKLGDPTELRFDHDGNLI